MRAPPRLIPLMLAMAISQAYAAPTVTGGAGADGTHASSPGAAGSAAGHGQDAAATAGAGDAGAVATGGNGGRGGHGAAGAPGQAGGRGGNGGDGGHATASHAVQSSAAQLVASALATAGRGGDRGNSGEGGAGAATGPQGTGGRGGNATASVTATGTGTITASSRATGGTSGYLVPIGAGERFGSAIASTTVDGGSSATVTADADAIAGARGGGNAVATLHATGYRLSLGSKVSGGSGAYANGLTGLGGNDGGSATGRISGTAGLGGASAALILEGGAGGDGANGADVVARNPFDVTTTGRLDLYLSGKGGDAGWGSDNPRTTGGLAGNADLELVLHDQGASSLAMQVHAMGGEGSVVPMSSGGQASRGGNASARLQGVTNGEIELLAKATGGQGGHAHSGAAGHGGDALAVASGTTHLPPRWGSSYPGDVSAVAVGGAGGISWSDGVRAGDGGTAQASATVQSRTLYEFDLTEATAVATGGEGGKATTLGGIAGNGGAVRLVDSVGGSAASRLELRQEAYGGAGGLHTGGGVGGSGGAALSQLTLADAVTPALTVTVLASGGNGPGGNGGGAQAILELASTSAGAAVRGNAHATGGNGGIRALAGDALAHSTVRAAGNGESSASALAGGSWNPGAASSATAFSRAEAGGAATASADADATTVSSNPGIARARAESISTGGSSTAFASGSGRVFDISAHSQAAGSAASRATVEGDRGNATALATSTSSGSGMRVETTAGATFASGGFFRFETRTSIGSTVPGQAYYTGSFANALPIGAVIPAGAPAVAAALEGQPIAAIGRMLGVSTYPPVPGAHHLTTASFRFDTVAPGALTLGMLDFRSEGNGFTELELIVSNHGSELFSWTFDSLAAAQAFFHDNVLDLGTVGAGSQDILIAADFTFDTYGKFDFDYVLGAQGLAPVPEPQVWMLMLLGLTVVLVRGRARRRCN